MIINHEIVFFNHEFHEFTRIFLELLFHISRTKMLAFFKLEKLDIIKN